MKSIFDSILVPVPCDKCGAEFEETIERLKTSPDLACPNCEHTIRVDGARMREGLELFEEWRKKPYQTNP